VGPADLPDPDLAGRARAWRNSVQALVQRAAYLLKHLHRLLMLLITPLGTMLMRPAPGLKEVSECSTEDAP
jgi:hypothetical protein